MKLNEAIPDKTKKMKEMVLYFCEQSERDEKFCVTKLNKQLFYSELLACRMTGKPITDTRYQHQQGGAVSRCLLPLREEMEGLNELEVRCTDYFGKTQHKYIAKRKPDMSIFTDTEKLAMNAVLDSLKDNNAKECSQFSHDFIGWELTEMGEDIPLRLALVGVADELSKDEIQYAQSLEEEANSWLVATK